MPKDSQLPPPRKNIVHTCISPQTWDLKPAGETDIPELSRLGLPRHELENRARRNTYDWLKRDFNTEAGAFHGFYDPRDRSYAPPQTVNLIAPFQLLAAFDRYQDEELLTMACRCSDWLEDHLVETHPRSVVLGGVRDNIKERQLWTKYTGDYVTLNLGLWARVET